MTPLLAHIPAPAHGPDATARAPGNTGHRHDIEARVTWRTAGRSDPSAHTTGTATATGGRFPGMPGSALMERVPRGPETPHPRPARARGHEHRPEVGLQTACQFGVTVFTPPSSSAPPCSGVDHGHPPTRRDGGGGHSGRPTGWPGHVVPLPTPGTGWMPPCLHHQSRAHARGRRRPAPPCGAPAETGPGRAEGHYRPCHRTAAVAAPAGAAPHPGRDASPRGMRIATVMVSLITSSGLACCRGRRPTRCPRAPRNTAR
ncbi:hypothetical protein ABID95_007183 [Streptomyces atratus]